MRIVSETFSVEPLSDQWGWKIKKQTLTVILSDGRKAENVLCYYEDKSFNPVDFARDDIVKFLRSEGIEIDARS